MADIVGYGFHKIGGPSKSVMADVRVRIGPGQFSFPVLIADQGGDDANRMEAKRELRKVLQQVLEVLGES